MLMSFVRPGSKEQFVRSLSVVVLTCVLAACGGEDENQMGTAVVENAFTNAKFTLVKVSYQGTLFDAPVALGAKSAPKPVKLGAARAYAIASWGWDPASEQPPAMPIVMRLKDPVETTADAPGRVVFSEPSHFGKCGGLSEAEYLDIAKTYFPGDSVAPYASIMCGP
jgi:hypothetical protein